MAEVRFDHATRLYAGAERPAVDALDLNVDEGEFLCLVGPSGCGKSTSLRMLAGLEDVNGGAIRIAGKDVTELQPRDRDIAMVFQSYALYPHMSVAENMGFALKVAGVDKQERRRRVVEAAKMLDLEGVLERRPRALSGGQRQRVAMGRAIVREPQVFLMDEPLSNLDAQLRVSTRTQIAALQRRLGVTTLYVTHDQVEAMTMGDRVAVLRDGVLQQVDRPLELFERPANVFVASFIGSPGMNIETVRVVDGQARLGRLAVDLSRAEIEAAAHDGHDRVVLGFRPESLEIAPEGEGFPAVVNVVEELGSEAFAYCSLDAREDDGGHEPVVGKQIVARVDPRRPPQRGEVLRLVIRPEDHHLFSATTGARIGA
jgi:multiple sugar transport system ATP-binding protein